MKKANTALAISMFVALFGGQSVFASTSVQSVPEQQQLSNTQIEEIINNELEQRTQHILKKDLPDQQDEALLLIALTEDNGDKLKDYHADFSINNINKNPDGTVSVTGYLEQDFIWRDAPQSSGMGDEVTFTLSPKGKIMKESLPHSKKTIGEALSANKAQKIKMDSLNINNQVHAATTVVPYSWTSYSFNGILAAQYAYQYSLSNNSSYYTFDNDCTNFASQALHAGGIPMRNENGATKRPNWWIQSGSGGQFLYAVPWVNAEEFFMLIRGSDTIDGKIETNVKNLDLGDIISYDKYNDGDKNHTAIVTGYDSSGYPLVCYHTTNRRNVAWNYYIVNTDATVTAEFTHIT